MYTSIIATDMLTLRRDNDLERLDAIQLADLGIERRGNAFLRDGKVVHQIATFSARAILSRLLPTLAQGQFRSAQA